MVRYARNSQLSCDPDSQQYDQFQEQYKNITQTISIRSLNKKISYLIKTNYQETAQIYSFITQGNSIVAQSNPIVTQGTSTYQSQLQHQNKQKQRIQLYNLSEYLTYKSNQFKQLQNTLKSNLQKQFKALVQNIKQSINSYMTDYKKCLKQQFQILKQQTKIQIKKIKSQLKRIQKQIDNQHKLIEKNNKFKSSKINQIFGISNQQFLGYKTLFKLFNSNQLKNLLNKNKDHQDIKQIKQITIDNSRIKNLNCHQLWCLIDLVKNTQSKNTILKQKNSGSTNQQTIQEKQLTYQKIDKQQVLISFQQVTFKKEIQIIQQLETILMAKNKHNNQISDTFNNLKNSKSIKDKTIKDFKSQNQSSNIQELSNVRSQNSINCIRLSQRIQLNQLIKEKVMKQILKKSKYSIQKSFEQFNKKFKYIDFIQQRKQQLQLTIREESKGIKEERKGGRQQDKVSREQDRVSKKQQQKRIEEQQVNKINKDEKIRQTDNNAQSYYREQINSNNNYNSSDYKNRYIPNQYKYPLNQQQNRYFNAPNSYFNVHYHNQASSQPNHQRYYPQQQRPFSQDRQSSEIEQVVNNNFMEMNQQLQYDPNQQSILHYQQSQPSLQQDISNQGLSYQQSKLNQQQANNQYNQYIQLMKIKQNLTQPKNDHQFQNQIEKFKKQKLIQQSQKLKLLQQKNNLYEQYLINQHQRKLNQLQNQTKNLNSNTNSVKYQPYIQQQLPIIPHRKQYISNYQQSQPLFEPQFFKRDQQKQKALQQFKKSRLPYQNENIQYVTYDFGQDYPHNFNQGILQNHFNQISSIPGVDVQEQLKAWQQFQKRKYGNQLASNSLQQRFNAQINYPYRQYQNQNYYNRLNKQQQSNDSILQFALNQSLNQTEKPTKKKQFFNPFKKFLTSLATNVTNNVLIPNFLPRVQHKSQSLLDNSLIGITQFLSGMSKKKTSFSIQQDFKYQIDQFQQSEQLYFQQQEKIQIKVVPRNISMIRHGQTTIRQLIAKAQQLHNTKQQFSIFVKIIKPVLLTFKMRDKRSNIPMTKLIVGDQTGMAILYMNYYVEVTAGLCIKLENCRLHRYRNSFQINHFKNITRSNFRPENAIQNIGTDMLSLIRKFGNQILYEVRPFVNDFLIDCVRELSRNRSNYGAIILRKPIIVTVCEINQIRRTWTLGDYTGKILADLSESRINIYKGDTLIIRFAKIQASRGMVQIKTDRGSAIIKTDSRLRLSHDVEQIPNKIFNNIYI